ncbi:MAG: HEAT repeat domain-containing protein [Cyanobacteria bacterium J06581_3]
MSNFKTGFNRYYYNVCKKYENLQSEYIIQNVTDGLLQHPIDGQGWLEGRLISKQHLQKEAHENTDSDDTNQRITSREFSVLKGLQKYAQQHVLLLGGSGLGKTTALERVFLEAALKQETLPILIPLREYKTSVFDLAYFSIKQYEISFRPEILEEVMTQGKCLLLLDGLNELPSKSAQSKSAQLDLVDFLSKYGANRVIASTKNFSFEESFGVIRDFGISKKLTLMPFTEGQVQDFIGDRSPSVQRGLERTEHILGELQRTPFFLRLLRDSLEDIKEEDPIPERLGLMLRKAAQKRTAKPVPLLAHSCEVLSYLAFMMMKGQELDNPILSISEEDAADKLSNRCTCGDKYNWARGWIKFLSLNHLLQRTGVGDNCQIQFEHQLWEEYYAAEYLLEEVSRLKDLAIKVYFLNSPTWTDSLMMMISLMDRREDAFRIITLGIEVNPYLGARLVGALDVRDQPEGIRKLLTYRLSLSKGILGWRIPLNLVGKPLRQCLLLALTSSKEATPHIVPFLKSKYSLIRESAASALGSIGSTNAIEPLCLALDDPAVDVRKAAVQGLSNFSNNKQATSALIKALNDVDNLVQEIAAEGLGRPDNNKAIQPLITALDRKGVFIQETIIKSIGKIGNQVAVNALIDILEHDNKRIKWNAAEILGTLGEPISVEPLIKALHNEEEDVRSSAAEALGMIGHKRAVEPLIKALDDRFIDVRLSAAEALGMIGHERAIEPLVQFLNNRDNGNMRYVAAEALGMIGHESAIEPLIEAIGYVYISSVRCSAAAALHKISPNRATSILIRMLENTNSDVRSSIADSIIDNNNSQTFQLLIEALSHSNWWVRSGAVGILGRLAGRKALAHLIKQCNKDPDNAVRCNIALALGKIGDKAALEVLIEALLSDSCNSVRKNAAQALGEIKSPKAIEPLVRSLDHPYLAVRLHAAEALGEIGNEQAVQPLIKSLGDEVDSMQAQAIKALEKIDKDIVSAELCRTLGDPRWHVRANVAHALKEIGNEQAIPPLQDALKDSNPKVTSIVSEAIKAIQNRQHEISQEGHTEKRAKKNLGAMFRFDPELESMKFLGIVERSRTIEVMKSDFRLYNHEIYQTSQDGNCTLTERKFTRDDDIPAIEEKTLSSLDKQKIIQEVVEELKIIVGSIPTTNTSEIEAAVHHEYATNSEFRNRLWIVFKAGYFETLKVSLPFLNVLIEMIKAWIESAPPYEGELPPGGF